MSEAPTPTPAPVEAPATPPAPAPAPVPPVAEVPEVPTEVLNPLAGSPLGETPPPAEGEAPAAPSEEGGDGGATETPLSPESYEFKLPDGVSVDETAMTSLKQTLAESKVAPKVAQSLLDMHIAELNKSAEAFASAQAAAWTETVDGWKTAINADPELGGDAKATVTVNIARMFDEYGSAEARAAFELTGAGWNPHIIKFVNNMAKALGEGSPHPANGPPSNQNRTPSAVLYPPKEN